MSLLITEKNQPYQDNLCFFRCLKLHFNNNKKVKVYFRMWLKYNNQTMDKTQFSGIMFGDIIDIEKCFNI